MNQKVIALKPKWWQLYVTGPLVIFLLLAQSQVEMPTLMHQLVEIGVVLFSFILMGLWVHVNQAAIIDEERDMDY